MSQKLGKLQEPVAFTHLGLYKGQDTKTFQDTNSTYKNYQHTKTSSKKGTFQSLSIM